MGVADASFKPLLGIEGRRNNIFTMNCDRRGGRAAKMRGSGQVLVLRHLPDIDLSAFIDAWLGTARPGGSCCVIISPHITNDSD